MLIDSVTIICRGGNGGNGGSTLSRTAQTSKGGPDGGNGGNGGSVYAVGSSDIRDLSEFRYKKKIVAESGVSGKAKNMYGKNAPDLEILLPVGTQITDLDSGQVFEISEVMQRLKLVAGGRGGRGNVEFKTATNQTPIHGEPGEPGQVKRLFFNLRIIADVGLIGLPNAGKSSLLKVLTNATPAIGNYPFTTLEPNIGMFGDHPIADIPGLIEGASQGKGLGIKFLKHIEKTKILVHCIDVSGEDPLLAYKTVREEFKQFSESLADKPEFILLTKIDLAEPDTTKKYLKLFQKKGLEVLTCSIYDPDSISSLKSKLGQKIL
jgi:GTP-binding protein